MPVSKFKQYGSKNIKSVKIVEDDLGKMARIKEKGDSTEKFLELDKITLKDLNGEEIREVNSGLFEKVKMITVTIDKDDNTEMNIFLE